MSYMALYRKWRPDEFQEVKGQEHIVTTLKNQIKHERIGHAYLFCGTRGTGKTTIAKLMAKAVNCEHPVDGSPCNECESCKSIAAGTSMNVIEIDAASNNGVDNIRQINNAVQYSPSSGRYLVYIIDEVHMLSIGAFNALLKTLEEPPEYVIFILATTEAHKIPITILSRCQRYDFKRISMDTITDRLEELLQRENVPATREALSYISKAADGSMRDALSILDQCIAFNLGEELTYDKVLDTIGAVDIDIYMSLFEAIKSYDVVKATDIINEAIWQGKDLTQFINEFTGFIRNVLMLKLNQDMSVDVTSDNIPKLVALGTDMEEEKLISFINILQEAAGKIIYATTKRIVLEVAIIKMCKPEMRQDYSSLIERIDLLEKELEEAKANVGAGTQVVYVNQGDEIPAANHAKGQQAEGADESQAVVNNLKTKYKEADYKELLLVCKAWNQIKANSMKLIRNFLDKAQVVPSEIPSTIDIIINTSKENELAISYFEDTANILDLEKKVAEITERSIKFSLRKVNQNEQTRQQLDKWDLSKIKFDNIEIY